MRWNSEHLLEGAALPVLTDPLAFGEAGRRYALATAGAALDLGEESLSDQDGEEEEESSAEESPRSSRGSEGGGEMPQEIAQVAQKQAAEVDRQRGKRARRRREVGKKPSGLRSRQARKGVEKERYKQTENFRARKREQKARANARKREANRQPGEVGLELLAE